MYYIAPICIRFARSAPLTRRWGPCVLCEEGCVQSGLHVCWVGFRKTARQRRIKYISSQFSSLMAIWKRFSIYFIDENWENGSGKLDLQNSAEACKTPRSTVA